MEDYHMGVGELDLKGFSDLFIFIDIQVKWVQRSESINLLITELMKKTFREYYHPDEEEKDLMWKEGVFIFDTNALLNLYRYSHNTAQELLDTLSEIKDRIWIPHQVGLEFHRHRQQTIAEQDLMYTHISKDLENLLNSAENLKGKYSRHSYVRTPDMVKKITQSITDAQAHVDKLKEKHPNWHKNDDILTKLTELFENKVGAPYSEKVLSAIYEQATERYDQLIPPGFLDEQKDAMDHTGKRKFGDYIIWSQIIDYAKANKSHIIFITDDKKEDWWKIVHGRTICPRVEITKEIYDKAEVLFYMYDLKRFLDISTKYLSVHPSEAAKEEIESWENHDYTDSSMTDVGIIPSISVVESFPQISLPSGLTDIVGTISSKIDDSKK